MQAGPSWIEVLIAMVGGDAPEPTLRGVIRSMHTVPRGGIGWTSFGGDQPVFIGPGSGDWLQWRVWRDGGKVRIETADGEPRAICDGTTLWRFESGSDVPVEAAANAMRLIGTAERLLLRRAAHEFAGDDFTRPTGPIGTTTFLGRPAWTVEFAPPLRKPYPLQQVVDQETGIVLQQRSDQAGLVIDEWLSIAVGEPIDDGLFTWAGPVVTTAEQQRSRDAEHERRRQELRDWFARNVTDSPLTVRVPLDLAVDYVHTHDDATGAFEASIGTGLLSGSLARRARSAEPWDLSWIESAYRWSTDEHDWAVYLHHRAELDRAALTELQARLGATPQ